MSSSVTLPAAGLIKNQLSGRLCLEIMNGSLKPGKRILEGKGAARFGVALASIREAINILSQAGFATKALGRSARMIYLSESDVVQINQLREVIERLAARLAAQSWQDPNALQTAMDTMRESARTGDYEALIYCDLLFHLALSELSHNPYLIKHARHILVPLFAFTRVRVSARVQSTSAWEKDLDAHQRNIELIRQGRERSRRALCEEGHGSLCKDRIRLLGETRRTCRVS